MCRIKAGVFKLQYLFTVYKMPDGISLAALQVFSIEERFTCRFFASAP